MAHQEHKCGSRSTQTLGQEITPLRAKSAATLVEMETTHAGNVSLAGRNKIKKLILGFIASLR
jgi:hypothetical protein